MGALVSVSLTAFLALAAAPAAQPRPAAPASGQHSRTALVRCAATAAAAGAVASAPGIIPLWLAGAGKGVAVSNLITDAMARQRTPKDQDPTLTRLKLENDELWFIAGAAVVGAVLSSWILWPAFAVLMGVTVAFIMVTTDGLYSGVCRSAPSRPRPLAHKLQTALIPLPLLALALLPMPVALLPTLAGAALLLISAGLLPAAPLLPGLGPVDVGANIKRAGILQTSSWPMLLVSTLSVGVALSIWLLNSAPPVRGGE